MEPSEGTLEPDQKLNLRVIFTPVLHRESPYSQTIPLRISLNPASKALTCSGRGETPKVGGVVCTCIWMCGGGRRGGVARM